jgi:hypothetical protein
MLCEFTKDGIGAVAGMNSDIGVDEISQDLTTRSISPAEGQFDGLPLFDVRRLWHAPQSGNCIL